MTKKNVLGIAVAALFMCAGSVQAATIGDSFTNDETTTEIDTTTAMDKFDSALGTLNSVTLNLGVSSSSTSTLTNEAAGDETFSFSSILKLIGTMAGLEVTPAHPTYLRTTLADTTDESDSGGFGGAFITMTSSEERTLYAETPRTGLRQDSNDITQLVLTGTDMDAFIGTTGQTFNTTCQSQVSTTFDGGGGNIGNVQTTTAGCYASVSYDYSTPTPATPTPSGVVAEPMSLALMGMGLLGFGGFSRRRK